jgi:hypothetical protein
MKRIILMLTHRLLFRSLDRYKKRVCEVAPQLAKETVSLWTISKAEALAMSYFLERLEEEEFTILDVGTFVGLSAFFFASQAKVRRVVSVDPDPLLSEEVVAQYRRPAANHPDKRVLEVAREALRAFPSAGQKVELKAGVVGVNEMALVGKDASQVKRVAIPREPLVAFVDAKHSSEGVYQDLLAIFRQTPQALVFLHDCEGSHGPSVQSGVASFLKEADYHFTLFGRLRLGLGRPSLGLVHPQGRTVEIRTMLRELSSLKHLLWFLMQATSRARLRTPGVGAWMERIAERDRLRSAYHDQQTVGPMTLDELGGTQRTRPYPRFGAHRAGKAPEASRARRRTGARPRRRL